MATFAKAKFNAANYSVFRPVYPKWFYYVILGYHRGPRTTALDIGCGSGQATRPLAAFFDSVTGLDPSHVMIDAARRQEADGGGSVAFQIGPAEDLTCFSPASVDLATAAEAAHWFDLPAWFRECSRVLRPNGTLAYWGYSYPGIRDHPKAAAALVAFGSDPDGIGPMWPKGREIVDRRYVDIVPPASFTDVERYDLPMTLDIDVERFEGLIRTWSSVHNFLEQNHQVPRSKGGSGDIVDEFMDRLAASEGWSRDTPLCLEYSVFFVLARSRDSTPSD